MQRLSEAPHTWGFLKNATCQSSDLLWEREAAVGRHSRLEWQPAPEPPRDLLLLLLSTSFGTAVRAAAAFNRTLAQQGIRFHVQHGRSGRPAIHDDLSRKARNGLLV
jgi:hypothetical protein